MVKITEYKLRRKAKNKGIIGYQNKSKRKLLKGLYKSKRITENLSMHKLNKILKMQNISLNKLEKIEKTNNKSIDELKQVAKIRDNKDYQDMSKEDLLIALFKSNKSHRELRKSKYNNTEIKDTKNIFNELRNTFSRKKKKEY